MRLPDDVLTEIFTQCIPAQLPGWSAGLDVSQVCKAWRMVAMATPRLWTMVELSTDSDSLAILPVLSNVLPRRSERHPLSLSFDIDALTQPIAMRITEVPTVG